MRKVILALAASASLLSGCTTEQTTSALAAFAAGVDAGAEVAAARREAEALRTARILAVQQQFAANHGSALITTLPQPPSWPGTPPSIISW
jgi:hypothetical protein